AGGQNKLFVVWIASNGGIDSTHCEARISSATLNGVSLPTFVQVPGTRDRACYWYSYLVSPTSGTFQINYNVSNIADFVVFTLQDADQTSPIDVSSVINSSPASTLTASATTTRGSDFVISWGTSA